MEAIFRFFLRTDHLSGGLTWSMCIISMITARESSFVCRVLAVLPVLLGTCQVRKLSCSHNIEVYKNSYVHGFVRASLCVSRRSAAVFA